MTLSLQFKSPSSALRAVLFPLAALVIAMLSVQIGAAFVKGLFPQVGVAGATTLRLVLASLMLLVVWRPWRRLPKARETRSLLVYGVSMGVMNLCFYSALARIPLGIAVALEFSGPLAVAVAASRRGVDFVWIALAALGLVALLPLGFAHAPLSPAGIAFALAAGACWALYIVFGQKAGTQHGGMTAALGTVIGAIVIIPFGLAQAGVTLLDPRILPAACAIAFLSSALPYSLEIFALTRLPTRTFGVLMSAEPALGALSGWCFLHEHLSRVQWAAVVSIMLASAGTAITSRGAVPPSA